MKKMLGMVGFGEAGRTLATAGGWKAACVYDRLTDIADRRDAMRAAYATAAVIGCDTLAEAIDGAPLILSLVTADQALLAAEAAAAHISRGAIYCDMNSVAPDTKRAAARIISAAGGHYVDVAVMAPVDPARLSVPLLLSGDHAGRALTALGGLGLARARIIGDEVGRASSIKMIRSVMVKGIEALTAECLLAAAAAGVADEVVASLDASDKPRPWGERADYNFDRMMIHGVRRAAEMEEVVKTLDALGTGSAMARGTVEWQRAIGAIGLSQPAHGLPDKIEQIQTSRMHAA